MYLPVSFIFANALNMWLSRLVSNIIKQNKALHICEICGMQSMDQVHVAQGWTDGVSLGTWWNFPNPYICIEIHPTCVSINLIKIYFANISEAFRSNIGETGFSSMRPGFNSISGIAVDKGNRFRSKYFHPADYQITISNI